MKKYFFLIVAFIQVNYAIANSQTLDDDSREMMSKLILLSLDKKADNDKEIIKITDSLFNNLTLIKDQALSDEIKLNISKSLLTLKNKQFTRPIRVEVLLNDLKAKQKTEGNPLYNKAIIANLHSLYSEYGWNPKREFNVQTFQDAINSLSYKYYNNQPVDDSYGFLILQYLSENKNAGISAIQKENVLIKLSVLIKNNINLVSDTLKNTLYTELKDNLTADHKKYLIEFRDFNTLISATASTKSPANKTSAPTNSLYAGIEIGSSAVKLSIIEFTSEDNETIYFKSLCEPKTIPINSRNFTARNYQDIAKNVNTFYKCLLDDVQNQYNFKDKKYNIFIVYSSGFCNNFITQNKQADLDSLDKNIRTILNDEQLSIKHLLPEEESAFTHLGLIQNKRLRNDCLVVDIGNGNTKGGYYTRSANASPSPKDFTPFRIDLASGSLKDKVDKKSGTKLSISEFNEKINEYLKSNRDVEIGNVVSNIRGMANKRYVYFSGGISWVISTLKKPVNPKASAVEINRSDIVDFITRMTDSSKFSTTFDHAKLDYDNLKINKNDLVKCAECSQPEFIFDVFDQKLCISGANVMLEIMDQLNSSGIQKRYFVTSNGKLAWIMAFIVSSME